MKDSTQNSQIFSSYQPMLNKKRAAGRLRPILTFSWEKKSFWRFKIYLKSKWLHALLNWNLTKSEIAFWMNLVFNSNDLLISSSCYCFLVWSVDIISYKRKKRISLGYVKTILNMFCILFSKIFIFIMQASVKASYINVYSIYGRNILWINIYV